MTYVDSWMKKELSEHYLEEITPPDSRVRAFYMKKKGTRIMSTLLVFTPEGISIMGDLTPNRRGNVSDIGYGLEWFSGQLDESYLCGKFLDRVFVPSSTVELLKQWKEEYNDLIEYKEEYSEQIECLDHAIFMLTNDLWSEFELYDYLSDNEIHVSDGIGYTYDPNHAAWLCAIQQRFSELYHAS